MRSLSSLPNRWSWELIRLCRSAARLAHHFADALVIEKSRNARGAEVNAHSTSYDDRFGVIDVNMLPADKPHAERTKRLAFLVGLQRSGKMFGGHIRIIPDELGWGQGCRMSPRRGLVRLALAIQSYADRPQVIHSDHRQNP